MPVGNQTGLITLLEGCIVKAHATHDNHNAKEHLTLWRHLGIATFINWLRYFDKPQARRPVWLIKHPVHSRSFNQAEHSIKATQPHSNSPIRYGYYKQTQSIDMAAWMAFDIEQRLAFIKQESTQPQTIAVLAPK